MINTERLQSYHKIFGTEKMLFLWKEYLEQATHTWESLESFELTNKRASFHNWRSSSLVFGMEEFATRCSKIEENIIQKRLSALQQQIIDSKACFDQSILLVDQIMKEMEIHHA